MRERLMGERNISVFPELASMPGSVGDIGLVVVPRAPLELSNLFPRQVRFLSRIMPECYGSSVVGAHFHFSAKAPTLVDGFMCQMLSAELTIYDQALLRYPPKLRISAKTAYGDLIKISGNYPKNIKTIAPKFTLGIFKDFIYEKDGLKPDAEKKIKNWTGYLLSMSMYGFNTAYMLWLRHSCIRKSITPATEAGYRDLLKREAIMPWEDEFLLGFDK